MGIIILPFLFGAFVIGIFSLIKTIKLLINKQIGFKEFFFGLTTSIILLGLICLSYIIEGKVWALSPAFRIPTFMVFIPFVFHISTEKNKNSKLAYFSKIILVSIGITVIFGVIFNDFFLGLLDNLGIEKHY